MSAPRLSLAKGFTLVELLLVVALLGITVGVTSDILLSIVRTYNKTQVLNEIEQQANFVSLKLEKELRSAIDVSVGVDDALTISLSDGTTSVYRLVDVSGFGVIRRENQLLTYDLTKADMLGGVTVSCGPTGCFTVAGTSPTIVSYDLVFAQAGATDVSFTGSSNISNTIVIRYSY
ncbi:prepilin-type N-terminal cleavage/methylation domain-containing protein [Patescibacteria group bacterium]|nr:prepilin-type N-terminal cleavage/methylation domain-containing protein [Patescibacteria group bacterium]